MENKPSLIYQVEVYVTTKDGVPDPHVPALTESLHELGFSSANVLSVGKTVRLFVESESPDVASDLANQASEKLLANPVYQQYEVAEPKELSEQEILSLNIIE